LDSKQDGTTVRCICKTRRDYCQMYLQNKTGLLSDVFAKHVFIYILSQ
jgi:hypothetical protein